MTDADLFEIPTDWPWRAHSRAVECQGIRWHVQQSGAGPVLLLVHGTGGSTHSWATVVDALATSWTVVAIDLPGHGFSHIHDANLALFALPAMARAIGALLAHLQLAPSLVAGHSAGVPLLIQLALDGHIAPSRIVGFNPALVAPPQLYLTFIAPFLGAIVEHDIVADSGAWLARSTSVIDLMLESSGSTLSAEQRERYRYLCSKPAHVHAAMTMMSRWDLPRLVRDAVQLRTPLHVVAGTRDRWVPAAELRRVVDRLPSAVWHSVEAGHLIVEEVGERAIEELRRAEI